MEFPRRFGSVDDEGQGLEPLTPFESAKTAKGLLVVSSARESREESQVKEASFEDFMRKDSMENDYYRWLVNWSRSQERSSERVRRVKVV